MNFQVKPQAPVLLHRLVSLTTIRDIELFELSLLKTLSELLKLKQLTMYKLNPSSFSCRLLTYTANRIENGDKRKLSESQEVYTSEMQIPEEIQAAQLWISTTGKPYTQDHQSHFSIIYPILGDNKIESLLSFELLHCLTESDVLIIDSLLSISYNFHSLLHENQRDKLTGLLNRQTFDESIKKLHSMPFDIPYKPQNEEFSESNRRKNDDGSGKFCLAIIDIDNFKQINDKFGHVMGDEVLLLIAYIMKQVFRSCDLLFRFGGEEFVCLLRTKDREVARNVLERFRQKIDEYRFPQVNKVTVSIGAILISDDSVFPTELVGEADKALYYAKNNGKNQLHFYEELLNIGAIEDKVNPGTVDLF